VLLLAVLAVAAFSVPSFAVAADEAAHETEGHEAPAGHDPDHSEEPHGDDPHGGGHGEVDLNPLSWKTDMAVWTGVVFVLLLIVLGKFAWGPIADGLDKREQSIAGEIAAAEKANADAKAQLEEYQQKLAAAGEEVRQMIDQAKRDAEATGQTIVEKARDEADAEKRRAVEDIEVATSGALKDIAEQSATLAVELAGKIVHQRLSADEHSKLISEAVDKFAKLEPGQN